MQSSTDRLAWDSGRKHNEAYSCCAVISSSAWLNSWQEYELSLFFSSEVSDGHMALIADKHSGHLMSTEAVLHSMDVQMMIQQIQESSSDAASCCHDDRIVLMLVHA